MLRLVDAEGEAIASAAASFGVSRPTFYQAQSRFKERGLSGLLPEKPGPRAAHKLSDEVLDFVDMLHDGEHTDLLTKRVHETLDYAFLPLERIVSGHVVVTACFHGKRNPRVWHSQWGGFHCCWFCRRSFGPSLSGVFFPDDSVRVQCFADVPSNRSVSG